MIHALINALALAPATTKPSRQIQNLDTIIQHVQHFYGQGWCSLQASNALMGLILTTVFVLIVGWVFFDTKALRKKIKKARKEASESIKQKETELTARIEKEVEKMKNFSAAISFLSKAVTNIEQFHKTGDRASLRTAIKMYFLAYYHFLFTNDNDGAEHAKQPMLDCIDKIERTEVPILQKELAWPNMPIPEQFKIQIEEVLAAIQKKAQ